MDRGGPDAQASGLLHKGAAPWLFMSPGGGIPTGNHRIRLAIHIQPNPVTAVGG